MRLGDVVLAILVVVVWGGNFVAVKIGMQHFPPFFYTALRFVLVAAVLLPMLRWPGRRAFAHLLLLALTLGVGHFAMLIAALYHGLSIPSCVIITQLGVPFSCMLGTVFFQDRLGPWRTFGMVVSFAGLAVVVGAPDVTGSTLGLVMALGGGFTWACANIVMKKMGDVHIFQVLGWMAVLSLPLLLLISYAVEDNHMERIAQASWSAYAAVFYTAAVSTLFAYGVWYSLMRRYDISQVTPFSLLSPVFGIAFGQLFFYESLTVHIVAGGLLTMLGVAIIVLRRPKNIGLAESA